MDSLVEVKTIVSSIDTAVCLEQFRRFFKEKHYSAHPSMILYVCGPNDLLVISRVNAWHACIMNMCWLLLEYIKDIY